MSNADGWMFIECEVTDPPSMKGQTVDVFFSPEQVVELMRDCRGAAIRARSKSEADA